MIGEGPPNSRASTIHPQTTSKEQRSLKFSGGRISPRGYIPVTDDPYPTVPPLSLTTGGWIEEPSGRRVSWVPEDLRAGFKTAGRTVSLGIRFDRLMVMNFLEVLQ